ncbi:MAG: sufD [Francisellaceae bacterium]|nr:sufD [Francisellaceae bacterium]
MVVNNSITPQLIDNSIIFHNANFIENQSVFSQHLTIAKDTITIAANTQIQEPIYIHYYFKDEGSIDVNFLDVKIYIQENCKVSIVECFHFLQSSSSVLDIFTSYHILSDSQINHLTIFDGSLNTYLNSNTNIYLNQNAIYKNVILSENTRKHHLINNVFLNQAGCMAELYTLDNARNSMQSQKHFNIYHKGPHTQSYFKARGIAKDMAQIELIGKIIVEQEALNTEAYLETKNLLLSDKAQVTASPLLEIYTDEVKCKHGATIGALDLEALFYLQSRGIDKKEAENMLIQAFIDPIFDQINIENLDPSTLNLIKQLQFL